MELNEAVATFAGEKVGENVMVKGRANQRYGECWDLAEEALRTSGGKTSRDFDSTLKKPYRWGTEIKLAEVKAGDIVQFTDYKYTSKTVNADGSWRSEVQKRGNPAHTAIVAAVKKDNGVIEVFEQNVGGERSVQRSTLYFLSKKGNPTIEVSGQFKFYRPVSKPAPKKK